MCNTLLSALCSEIVALNLVQCHFWWKSSMARIYCHIFWEPKLLFVWLLSLLVCCMASVHCSDHVVGVWRECRGPVTWAGWKYIWHLQHDGARGTDHKKWPMMCLWKILTFRWRCWAVLLNIFQTGHRQVSWFQTDHQQVSWFQLPPLWLQRGRSYEDDQTYSCTRASPHTPQCPILGAGLEVFWTQFVKNSGVLKASSGQLCRRLDRTPEVLSEENRPISFRQIHIVVKISQICAHLGPRLGFILRDEHDASSLNCEKRCVGARPWKRRSWLPALITPGLRWLLTFDKLFKGFTCADSAAQFQGVRLQCLSSYHLS